MALRDGAGHWGWPEAEAEVPVEKPVAEAHPPLPAPAPCSYRRQGLGVHDGRQGDSIFLEPFDPSLINRASV